jgi:cytoskeletal protein RodZ
MADNSKQAGTGQTARVSHHKKKMVITASILMAAVPGAAVAMSINTHADSTKPASVSVQASSTSAATSNDPTLSAEPVAATVNASENSSEDSTSDTTVTVNGQDIPVPDNGTVNATVPNEDGSTSVHASSTGTANTSKSTSHTSTHVYSNSNGQTGASNINIQINQKN